jgi:hypothetical protein
MAHDQDTAQKDERAARGKTGEVRRTTMYGTWPKGWCWRCGGCLCSAFVKSMGTSSYGTLRSLAIRATRRVQVAIETPWILSAMGECYLQRVWTTAVGMWVVAEVALSSLTLYISATRFHYR